MTRDVIKAKAGIAIGFAMVGVGLVMLGREFWAFLGNAVWRSYTLADAAGQTGSIAFDTGMKGLDLILDTVFGLAFSLPVCVVLFLFGAMVVKESSNRLEAIRSGEFQEQQKARENAILMAEQNRPVGQTRPERRAIEGLAAAVDALMQIMSEAAPAHPVDWEDARRGLIKAERAIEEMDDDDGE